MDHGRWRIALFRVSDEAWAAIEPHLPRNQPGRHLIKNAFCRLKAFRHVHARYDKLAANFLSGVALVTAIAFWL